MRLAKSGFINHHHIQLLPTLFVHCSAHTCSKIASALVDMHIASDKQVVSSSSWVHWLSF